MIQIKAFVYPTYGKPISLESDLVGEEVIKLNEDGTRNWAGVPDREAPWHFDIEADEEVILEQER